MGKVIKMFEWEPRKVKEARRALLMDSINQFLDKTAVVFEKANELREEKKDDN